MSSTSELREIYETSGEIEIVGSLDSFNRRERGKMIVAATDNNETKESESLSARFAMHRVYFNRQTDAPNCWSVDNGTIQTERIVARIELVNVTVQSKLNLSADNVHEPKAWFEVAGRLELKNGVATITGGENPNVR